MNIIESLLVIPSVENSPAGKITLRQTKNNQWMVTEGNSLLSKKFLEFFNPPLPSNTDNDFFDEVCFDSPLEALEVFNKWFQTKASSRQLYPHYKEKYDYENVKKELEILFKL